MADAVQVQETGGGEGSAPAQPPQQNEVTKSLEPQVEPAEPSGPIEQAEAKKQQKASTVQAPVTKPEEAKPDASPSPQPSTEAPAASTSADEAAAPVSTTTDQNANNVEQNAASNGSDWQQIKLDLLKEIEELEKVKNQRSVDGFKLELKYWQQRELDLWKEIKELEKVKNQRSEDGFKLELKVREEEIYLLKARVRNLETELSGKNHGMIENIKQKHEELLSIAMCMISDKTKIVKNQELQIEALMTEVQSLKDINLITKDLLEIKDSEVKVMENILRAMEARFKVEKERFGLVLPRALTSSNFNQDLKKEYVMQLTIFKELREKYEQRVQALVAESERLKAAAGAASGPSAQ